ncbi:nuclear transport factor 2 family protein [uncultured Roseobacter sp.]|uniref:nuclear transport factor 2 family protein n=1 Tax=uncultured Roseobacter sp. TaxID=114847 RepID=UPI00262B0EBE|nr:nuclear transport factor 2 family protein [uncultured Roseobacter sp.]
MPLDNIRPIALTLGLAVCLPALTNGPANAADPLVEETNRQVVRDAFEGWEAGTFNVFDLLDADVVWTITGFDPVVSGTYRGKEDLLSRTVAPFSARMSEGLSPTLYEVWADGEDVLVRFDGQGRTAAGDIYKNHYLWIFTIEEGVVTEVTAFLDTAAFAALLSRDPGMDAIE